VVLPEAVLYIRFQLEHLVDLLDEADRGMSPHDPIRVNGEELVGRNAPALYRFTGDSYSLDPPIAPT
jgi:hypothetical protein